MNAWAHDAKLSPEQRRSARAYRDATLAEIDDWRAYALDGRAALWTRLVDAVQFSDNTEARGDLETMLRSGQPVAVNGVADGPGGLVHTYAPPENQEDEQLRIADRPPPGAPFDPSRVRHVFTNEPGPDGSVRGTYRAQVLEDDGAWVGLPNREAPIDAVQNGDAMIVRGFGPQGEVIYSSPWESLPTPYALGAEARLEIATGHGGEIDHRRRHALGIAPYRDTPTLTPTDGEPITASKPPPGFLGGIFGGERFTVPEELAARDAYYDDPRQRAVYDAWNGEPTVSEDGRKYFTDSFGTKHEVYELGRPGDIKLPDGSSVTLTEEALTSALWQRGGGVGDTILGSMLHPGIHLPDDRRSMGDIAGAFREASRFTGERLAEIAANLTPGIEFDSDFVGSFYTETPFGPMAIPNLTGNLEVDRALMQEPGVVRAIRDAQPGAFFEAMQSLGQGAAFLAEFGVATKGLGAAAKGLGRGAAWAASRAGPRLAAIAGEGPVQQLARRVVTGAARGFAGARGAGIIPAGHHADALMVGQFVAYDALANLALGRGTFADAVHSGVETGAAMWLMGNVARTTRRIARPVMARFGDTVDRLRGISGEVAAGRAELRRISGLDALTGGLPDSVLGKMVRGGLDRVKALREDAGAIARRSAARAGVRGELSVLRAKATREQVFDSAFIGYLFGAYGDARDRAAREGLEWSDLRVKLRLFREGLFSPVAIGQALAFGGHSALHGATRRSLPPEWSAGPKAREQTRDAIEAVLVNTRRSLAHDPAAAVVVPMVFDAELGERMAIWAGLSSREGSAGERRLGSQFEAALADDLRRVRRGGDVLLRDADARFTGNEVEHLGTILKEPDGKEKVRSILDELPEAPLTELERLTRELPVDEQVFYGREIRETIHNILGTRDLEMDRIEVDAQKTRAMARSLAALGEPPVFFEEGPPKGATQGPKQPAGVVDLSSYFEKRLVRDATGKSLRGFKLRGRPPMVVERAGPGGTRWFAINSATGKVLPRSPEDGFHTPEDAMGWVLRRSASVLRTLDHEVAAAQRTLAEERAERKAARLVENEQRARELAAEVADSMSQRRRARQRQDRSTWNTDLETGQIREGLDEVARLAREIPGEAHKTDQELVDEHTKPGDLASKAALEGAKRRVRERVKKAPKPKRPKAPRAIDAPIPPKAEADRMVGEMTIASEPGQAEWGAGLAETLPQVAEQVPQVEVQVPAVAGRFWSTPELADAFRLGSQLFSRTGGVSYRPKAPGEVSPGVAGSLKDILSRSHAAERAGDDATLEALAAGMWHRLGFPDEGKTGKGAEVLIASLTGLPRERVAAIRQGMTDEAAAHAPELDRLAPELDRLLPGWSDNADTRTVLELAALGAPVVARTSERGMKPSTAQAVKALRQHVRDVERDAALLTSLDFRIDQVGVALGDLPSEQRDLRGRLIRKLSYAHFGTSSSGPGRKVEALGGRSLGEIADGILEALSGSRVEFESRSLRAETSIEAIGESSGGAALDTLSQLATPEPRTREERLDLFTSLSRMAGRVAADLSRIHLHNTKSGKLFQLAPDQGGTQDRYGSSVGRAITDGRVATVMRVLAEGGDLGRQIYRSALDSQGRPLFDRPDAAWEAARDAARMAISYSQELSRELAGEVSRPVVDGLWRAMELEGRNEPLPRELADLLDRGDGEILIPENTAATDGGKLTPNARQRFAQWIRETLAQEEGVIAEELGPEFVYEGLGAVAAWAFRPFEVDVQYERAPWFGPRGKVRVGRLLDKLAADPPRSRAGRALTDALFGVVDQWQQLIGGGQKSGTLTSALSKANLTTRRVRLASSEKGERILALAADAIDRVRKMGLTQDAQVVLARAIDAGAYFRVRSEAEWERVFGDGSGPLYWAMRDIVGVFDQMGQELVRTGVLSPAQFKKFRGRYFPVRALNADKNLAAENRTAIMAGISPATSGERARSGAASIDDMLEGFDLGEILPAALAGEAARARVHGMIGETLRSVGRSLEEFAALTKHERVGWIKASEPGRQEGKKVTPTQVRLELWAQEEEAASGEGGAPMTPYKLETLRRVRESFLPRNALTEIDLMLDLVDGTVREGALMQETINYWRRLKTVENAKHWIRNSLSAVVTNHMTGRVSWIDFMRSVFTGRGVYAESAADLLAWYEWSHAGRPDLAGRIDRPEIELVDRITTLIGHGTFGRTVFEPTTVHELIGSMFRPDATIPAVPEGSGDAPLRSVLAALWRRGPGQANFDQRIAKLRGDPNPVLRAQAQLELQHLYQLTELFWKVAAIKNGLRSGMGEQEAVEWGVDGTADYANRNPSIYRMSSRFRWSLSGREELATEAAGRSVIGRRLARASAKMVAGPFWQYALQMVPALTYGALNHPLRFLGGTAILFGIHRAMMGTDGGDHEDLREAVSGLPGWGNKQLPPEVAAVLKKNYGNTRLSSWFDGSHQESRMTLGEAIDEFQAYVRNLDALAGPERGGRRTAGSLGEVLMPLQVASRTLQGGPMAGLSEFSVGWMAGQSISFAGRALEVMGEFAGGESFGEGAVTAANAFLREWSSDLGGGLGGSLWAPTTQRVLQEFSADGRSFSERMRGIRRPLVAEEGLGQRVGRLAADLTVGARDVPDVPAGEPGQNVLARMLSGTQLGRLMSSSSDMGAGEKLTKDQARFARDLNKQIAELWADGYSRWIDSGPRDMTISASAVFRQMLDLGADVGFDANGQPHLVGDPKTEIGRFVRSQALGDREIERRYLDMALSRLERLGTRPTEAIEILAGSREIHPSTLRRAVRGMIENESLLPFIHRMVVEEGDTKNLRVYQYLWERGGYATARYGAGSANRERQLALDRAFRKAGFPGKPSQQEIREALGGFGYGLAPELMLEARK